MTTLTNTFEGGTPGTTVTAANSGGLSGNAFDAVAAVAGGSTIAFDSTYAAHGSVSLKLATASTSESTYVQWTTSMGTQTTVWFRLYLYLTAYPALNTRLWNATDASTACGSLLVHSSTSPAGVLIFAGPSGSAILTSTNAVPLNQWSRIEGFLTGSASAGQVGFSLYDQKDSLAPTETQTSAATQDTTGPPTKYTFGPVAGAETNFLSLIHI